MPEKEVKIIDPGPQQIGTTPDGQPIWFEPKDLIPTPDENLERWDATLSNREKESINKMATDVLRNAIAFIEETFFAIAPDSSIRKAASGSPKDMIGFVNEVGLEAIQDGLKTIVKHRGKVIREMNAGVQPERFRKLVAKRMAELIRIPIPNAKAS